MARASKGARHITVDGVAYRWRASGADHVINVTVWPATEPGAKLTASVRYDETLVPSVVSGGWHCTRQIVVTNRIVRRVIRLAVTEHGYAATAGGSAVQLGQIDGRVGLSDALRSHDTN